MSRWRSIAVNLLVLAITLTLMALAIEGVARWYVKRIYIDPHKKLVPMSRFDPVLGWTKTPNVKRRIARAEYDVEIAFNSKGLRGPERDYAKPPRTHRILILGDSFAEGYYAEEPQTAAAVLERALDNRGCGPVEVINGGTLGYSTDQEYLFYRDEGGKYGAETVLLFFYSNDLYHNTRAELGTSQPKPMFHVEGENLVLANVPLQEPPPPKPKDLVPPPWRGSYALRFLTDRTIHSAPRLHALLARLSLVQKASTSPSRELWPFGPPRREVEDMWRRTEAILRALDREVRARGGRLATVYVPVRFEVNTSVWELTRQRYNWGRQWKPEAVFNRLRSVHERLGIPLFDPREALAAVDSGPAPAYYTRDLHWNALGNRIVGELVSDKLIYTGLTCGAGPAPAVARR